MLYHVGINDIEPYHWVAWVFELPGCFVKAKTHQESLDSVPQGIADHLRWLKQHEHPIPISDDKISFEVTEDIQSVTLPDGYIANALFEDDKKVLTEEDIKEARLLLSYIRRDLMETITALSESSLEKPIAGEVQKNIRGILNHIAGAELWYFDRIDLAPDDRGRSQKVMERLTYSRKHTLSTLPKLVGMREQFEKNGELWTAQKVIRRTLWHERAHTRQIQRYIKTPD